ncbi:MBL fold metallo-hydrolase [Serpentinicella sp. ANB-PHB4]|uniref:MBL fold metallo-hydrolase n=1 Tax=Serpentinicella sp. ANB-PHB4 TaxID=3074076 RepID=UPI002855469C|nr:MBL fold metallo-hydrolase [Serpentinicella sp. ANB-PHB4]MDR5659900.1 MBL fold metallo-hydrolase [Serpentinicella sp. ANB-PHB4]
MKIHFLGASKVVTGSNILITTDKYNVLLDCGLFQGSEELESLNQLPFEFEPKDIDYLFLSHSHIDHSGRIPKLVKEGFNGKILCTKATKELSEIMLVDSAHIQESDVNWENRKRKRAGKPLISPLYSVEEAEASLRYFESALYNQKISVNEDISVRFRDAGHILGSSIIEIWITENKSTTKIVFTGDLGMTDKPLIKNPEIIEDADYLIMESTYGNRLHENREKRTEKLMDIINETVLRGGSVIIPSFAVGRTQELIYELNKYYEYKKDLEAHMKIPIYIDSPMATAATEVFKENAYCFNDETRQMILKGDNPFSFENLYFIKSHEESMRLNDTNYPKVVISASGMCTAGRVRHHLKHNLWKANNSVVFVGYQANGTLGRLLQEGVKKVKLLGEEIVVLANIHTIEGFSGHADQQELLSWVDKIKRKPKRIFLVHGEEASTETLAKMLRERFNIKTITPNIGYVYQISNGSTEFSREILEPVQRKENIKEELQKVYEQFESLVLKTDRFWNPELLDKDYDKIKNKLLDLQRELLDLSILLGD